MADELQRPDDGASADESAKAGGIKGMLSKLPVLIGGVMVAEAVLLLVVFKMMGGGPEAADAHGLDDGHGEVAQQVHEQAALVEVPVDSFRAPNRLNGRTYLYDLEISVRVKADVEADVSDKIKASGGLIRDRMNRIVASIDPQKLNGAAEPGLETLRRQVRYQLDLIVGEGLIEEVLVPRCIPYRADY
jgi:hypothetical protein